MSKLKIAYITVEDPNDKHAWSGTNYYILQSLRKHVGDVDALGPFKAGLVGFVCKVINFVSLKLTGRRFDYRHSRIYAKPCSAFFQKKISGKNYDLIVAPAGISCIAYLKTKTPIVYIGDRVIEGALNYHEILSDLWQFSKEQSIETDKIALQNATLNIFSSRWAADFALGKYGIEKEKVSVIPFGANMDDIPPEDVAIKEKNGKCNLLLIGTSWKNKGADIAYNALLELLKKGIDANLTVCGCVPPDGLTHEKLTVIPFLNKNTEEGKKKLEELFLNSTFFILPTRFDCTPIVFCEASAYGLPVISANTGGVEGHIKQGVNGFLIDYNDSGRAYADKIAEIYRNTQLYNDLRKSARNLYDGQLNWDAWADEFKKAAKNIIS
ncbi:MAG: glycosyltransferase family 4 protein [Bacteroidia bacterium]